MFKLLTKPTLSIAIALSLTALTLPVQAEQTVPTPAQTLLSHFASTFKPPKDGAPEQTVPAGSRDEARCSGDSLPMRPLMPEANYGLTAEAHPMIWMEMPGTRAQEVLLVVQTETGEEHSRTQLAIPAATEQGMTAFQLPKTVEALTLGQNYRWTLSVLCEGYLNPNDPFFSGWIKRVEHSPEVAQTLANTSVEEKVAILQETGHWYDLVPLILENQDVFNILGSL